GKGGSELVGTQPAQIENPVQVDTGPYQIEVGLRIIIDAVRIGHVDQGEYDPLGVQFREQGMEKRQLLLRFGMHGVVDIGKMGVDPLEYQTGQFPNGPDRLQGLEKGNSQTAHSRIDLDMHPHLAPLLHPLPGKGLRGSQVRYRANDAQANAAGNFRGQQTSDDLNRHPESFHQGGGFLEFGHGQSIGSGFDQGLSHGNRPQPISIGLEHGHDLGGADGFTDLEETPPDGVEMNLQADSG